MLTIRGLESTGDEEPGHHEERSNQKGRSTAKLVEVENGRKRHGDIDDILD